MSIEGFGQVEPPALGQLLVLHEHQIPDFDETIAIGVGRTWRTAGNMLAMVVKNFRARATGPGVAHRPKVVRGGDADDAPVGKAGDLLPQVEGLVVLGIDRDGEPRRRQTEFLGDDIPGKLDGAVLKIIAEREIAQHLEERMVACRVADIVEIIVLAAGAHAFLRRRGAPVRTLLDAGEHILELHHPGIGEHQRRVVARDERR